MEGILGKYGNFCETSIMFVKGAMSCNWVECSLLGQGYGSIQIVKKG